MSERVEVIERLEDFLEKNNLQDAQDLDSLLDLASLVRSLANVGECSGITKVINYTVRKGYYDAFSWCMEIIQEILEKNENVLKPFECVLGKSIPNYDEFINRLQIDFNVIENGYDTVCDDYGEVESFFNNLVYKTKYENIYLISSENFDTKDNDYIRYSLLFKN